jgi:hypothetical protein
MIKNRFAHRALGVRSPRARTGRTRRIVGQMAAVAVLLTGVATAVVAGAGTASASTLNGVALTANPSTNAYLSSGGSATPFTLALPDKAACTGNTNEDGYHVWSYLVQPSVNIDSLTFSGGQPSQGLGLFEANSSYYGPADTAENTGQIIDIPTNFEWGPAVESFNLSSTLLYQDSGTSGLWEGGLACANTNGVLTDNWNFQITFTKSTTDPDGFTWSVFPGPAGDSFAVNSTSPLPPVTEGSAYTTTLDAIGGKTPYAWKATGLPKGLKVNAKTGVISGKVTKATEDGTYTVTVTVTDKAKPKGTATTTLGLQVAAPTS